MKLRWQKRLFYCLQNDAQQLKLTQCQRSYYAIPIHDPKMGLGLKIVKILSPLGHTPTSGHGTTSQAPLDCIDMSCIHPSIYLTAHWQLYSLLLFTHPPTSFKLDYFQGGTKIRKTTQSRIFSLKSGCPPPPPSSYLKQQFQAKNGNSIYLYLYFIYPPARRTITSAHLG